MAVLDEDFGTDLTLVEGNGGVRSCPVSLQTPISAGLCEGRGARRPRSSRCPGRTPGCARARKTSRNRIETLEVQLERLRATGAVLSRALYGRKSEQQDKPGSERKRGQQRGAPGHGRTQRPGLKERTEEHNPPPDDMSPWLPWSMSEERRRELMAPG